MLAAQPLVRNEAAVNAFCGSLVADLSEPFQGRSQDSVKGGAQLE